MAIIKGFHVRCSLSVDKLMQKIFPECWKLKIMKAYGWFAVKTSWLCGWNREECFLNLGSPVLLSHGHFLNFWEHPHNVAVEDQGHSRNVGNKHLSTTKLVDFGSFAPVRWKKAGFALGKRCCRKEKSGIKTIWRSHGDHKCHSEDHWLTL